MKKILSILVLIVFALMLSGCNENTERVVDDILVGNEKEHYTQEEVDALFEGYVEKSKLDSASDICLIMYGVEYDCLDELENDLEAINDLQAQIDELKSGNTITEYITCNESDIGQLLQDIIDERDDKGYTLQKDQLGDEFLWVNGNEYLVFTVGDIMNVYCSVD